MNHAATLGKLPEKPCVTKHLNIHGFHGHARKFGWLSVYGSDARDIQTLMNHHPEWAEPLAEGLPYVGAEAVWATRFEMAQTVEDVLSRRTRALFLNAKAALAAAPKVAMLMAQEMGRDENWIANQLTAFRETARHFDLTQL